MAEPSIPGLVKQSDIPRDQGPLHAREPQVGGIDATMVTASRPPRLIAELSTS